MFPFINVEILVIADLEITAKMMNIDHLVSIESTATADQVSGQNNGIQTWKGQQFSHSFNSGFNFLNINDK